jgi:hypothetical protein
MVAMHQRHSPPADAETRLKKEEWEVRDAGIGVARGLVQKLHYARGASNTATYLHGLFRRGGEECLGCAWWIPPTKSAALATHPGTWTGVLSLSRLVIDPAVPKNACTFLLARSRRMIPVEKWPCLVTYADTWRGHSGGIYRADNWEAVGLTSPEATFTVNGVMTARKAGGHTRTRAEMFALGVRDEGRHAKHKFVFRRQAKISGGKYAGI